MTARERYLATAAFEPVDRAFLLPPWAWNETLERWRKEGLPVDEPLRDRFQTDYEAGFPLAMQGWAGPHLHPPLERAVLSKVPWLCLQGGYFPQVDHLVPPDVSLENYTYYAKLVRAVVEDPEQFLREAAAKGFWKNK